MISEKMQAALNDQIREEMFSAYLYLAMSADFESKNLGGFASWMRNQAQEEMVHAMKFCDHLLDRGGEVKFQAIDAPQQKWDSPLAAFEAAYEHEKHISACIDKLAALARKLNDNAAAIMLDWFVDEQVEEEKTADEKVQALRMIGDSGYGLLMLDREAAARTFTPPADGDEG